MFSKRIGDKFLHQAVAAWMLSTLLSTGCASKGGICGVDCCADIPSGAIPQPAGTKVCEWQTAQVNSALNDQFVLYHADFVGDGVKLSPAAIARLARNTAGGFGNDRPYVIEPSADSSIDAARVGAVAEELASMGIANANIEIATPAAIGLRGTIAEGVALQIGNNRGGSNSSQNNRSGQSGNFGSNLSGGIF